jgi:hypothetical protein
MLASGRTDHLKDFDLARSLADAYRRADHEDRLIYPAEVLALLDAFQKLWPHYRNVVWPSLHDQIAISLQPGINASYEDPQEAAQAMGGLMTRLHLEFDMRSHDPADLLRYARRVRLMTSNVAGCARAVARVLQTLLTVRQPPSKIPLRLFHYFRVVRPLQRTDGLLSSLEDHFSVSIAALAADKRPIVYQ